MSVRTIKAEVMLLSWSETSNGGAKIVLQLPSPEDLEPWKSMTLAKGKVAGQRLMAVFAEVNEQEEPVEPAHRSLGPLGLLAVRWCRDPQFQAWATFKWQHDIPAGHTLTTEECRALILDVCKVGSRKDLDTVPTAGVTFQREFRHPYMNHTGGDE
jgi:hypothetical protein